MCGGKKAVLFLECKQNTIEYNNCHQLSINPYCCTKAVRTFGPYVRRDLFVVCIRDLGKLAAFNYSQVLLLYMVLLGHWYCLFYILVQVRSITHNMYFCWIWRVIFAWTHLYTLALHGQQRMGWHQNFEELPLLSQQGMRKLITCRLNEWQKFKLRVRRGSKSPLPLSVYYFNV